MFHRQHRPGARCVFDFGWHDFNRLGYREHRCPARATSFVLCCRCHESFVELSEVVAYQFTSI